MTRIRVGIKIRVKVRVRARVSWFNPNTYPNPDLGLNMTGLEAIEAIPRLPLCAAFFKEVLRLKSPGDVILLHTETNETVTLSNGIEVFPNDEVFVHLGAAMLDPKVFLEPKKFNPHRWLQVLSIRVRVICPRFKIYKS
jgi:cytochrome P450